VALPEVLPGAAQLVIANWGSSGSSLAS
jgi:hypothetical protein